MNTFLFETTVSCRRPSGGGSECGNKVSSANFLLAFHSTYGSVLLSFQDMNNGQTTDR